MTRSRRRLRDLPLFVKLLIPFLVLILVIGAGGLYLVVHDLSSRARGALNEELLRRSLDARSRIHDRELYLLESVNFASNLRGMAGAINQDNRADAQRLLHSVVALKTDLQLVGAVHRDGDTLVAFGRQSPGGHIREIPNASWGNESFVRRALRTRTGEKTSGLTRLAGERVLGIAAPICETTSPCRPIGASIVGMRLSTLASEAAGNDVGNGARAPGIAIYGHEGLLLAKSDEQLDFAPHPPSSWSDTTRRSETFESRRVETLYSPLEIRGRQVGTLAVRLDADLVFATVRGSSTRLALLFFLAIGGVVAIGFILSRYLLAQVHPLVETSRELGSGNLSARVPIVGRDELGELAGVLNGMADELQASHETLERRVEERTEQVQRLLEERTEFFTGISHELRTPIAIILSEARMLIDPEYDAARGSPKEAAEMISASAEQLLTRVNDILDLARGESGQLEMKMAEVDVADLLQELSSGLEARAAGNDLAFSLEIERQLPQIRADRGRLRDVVSNLVENAIKYTPSGGSVTVTATARNDHVSIAVSDTGVGIPADVGERIFEPFFQVAGTTPQHGEASSGLGLALAKRSIDALDGSITYSSVIDAGTTFTIDLPIIPGPRDPAGSNGSQTDRRYVRTAKTRR